MTADPLLQSVCHHIDTHWLPTTLWQKVLMMAHAGHLGMVCMKWKLCDRYWWPGFNTQAEFLVKHCEGCLSAETVSRLILFCST